VSDTSDVMIIEGGKPLTGTLPVFRAKNSALYLMLAALLTDEEVVLEDVPRLADVLVLEELLQHVGVDTSWEGHTLRLHARSLRTCSAPYGLVSKMRASFVIMGALVARCGEATVPMPGGCAFGPRPVDRHLAAMRALGVLVDEDEGVFHARRPVRMEGRVVFEAPTVGGTQNVLLAAALADGEVVIENAALEPEVADLANMLNAMGARVEGAGTRTITVQGVSRLHGVTYRPIPDRIEAGTYMLAAAATRGRVTLTDVEPSHLTAVIAVLERAGVEVTAGEGTLTIDATARELRPVDVRATEYPGVPTDLQAPFTAFLATVPGLSTLSDAVYPDRFTHVEELSHTGADLRLVERTLEVRGGPLKGAAMHAADIRAGSSLVIGALAATGTSEIGGLKYIDRGYEKLTERLASLGASVVRQGAAVPAVYGD
jgi:UDP-N-acetylglucosamine 1-carboxyvinyltransferase